MPAYVIRHGKAGDRSDWEGDDRLRPLTKSGRRQAEQLAATLKSEPIDVILTSPYVRCLQTVEPLAKAKRLTVQSSNDLAEGAGARGLLGTVQRLEGRTPALCTHGDVVEELLELLIQRRIIAQAGAANEKGGTWVLDMRAGDVRGAAYLPAP